jgi:hypothetical protein
MQKVLRERYESMKIMLDVFSFARIQEYYSLMITLKNLKISDDEFMAWVRFRQIEGSAGREKKSRSFFCPDCGRVLSLMPVNNKSCNNVGGDYNSMFSCVDLVGCGYSRYSTDTVKYWIKALAFTSKPATMAKMIAESDGCSGCGS